MKLWLKVLIALLSVAVLTAIGVGLYICGAPPSARPVRIENVPLDITLGEHLPCHNKGTHADDNASTPQLQRARGAPTDSLIPPRIMQFHRSHYLGHVLAREVQKTRVLNPGYAHEFFDENEARDLIQEIFDDQNVLDAFDILRARSGKRDLFRAAYLYKFGGWAPDLSIASVLPFAAIQDNARKELYVVRDRADEQALLLLGAQRGHPAVKKVLDQIVKNVLLRKYGKGPQDATGLHVCGKVLQKHFGQMHEGAQHGYYLACKSGDRVFAVDRPLYDVDYGILHWTHGEDDGYDFPLEEDEDDEAGAAGLPANGAARGNSWDDDPLYFEQKFYH